MKTKNSDLQGSGFFVYYAKPIIIKTARKSGGERRSKNFPQREILLLPNSLRGAACLKRKEEFRPLRRSARALPLTHELLKKFDQNFNLFI
ncbi:MAG: hypothetical protein J6S71_05235 [Clostridia bacterium]|nr:hypothetical protein [Clostridia bacterium]